VIGQQNIQAATATTTTRLPASELWQEGAVKTTGLLQLTAGVNECTTRSPTPHKDTNLHQLSQSRREDTLSLRRPSHLTPLPTPDFPDLPQTLIPSSHLLLSAMAATESNAKVATHATELPTTSNCDPFIDNTNPRHDRGSLAAFMAAIQQVSKCLLAFTWHSPRRSPSNHLTAFNPSLHVHVPLCGSSQLSRRSPWIFCVHCSHVHRLFRLRPLHRHRPCWLADPKPSPIVLCHAADNALTSP
jgi:hypothetical protein